MKRAGSKAQASGGQRRANVEQSAGSAVDLGMIDLGKGQVQVALADGLVAELELAFQDEAFLDADMSVAGKKQITEETKKRNELSEWILDHQKGSGL